MTRPPFSGMSSSGLAFGGVLASVVAICAAGALGGPFGTGGVICGVVTLLISLSQLRKSSELIDEQKQLRAKPPATELEALVAIERRMAAVEDHAAATRLYVGWVLAILAILTILAFFGQFASRVSE